MPLKITATLHIEQILDLADYADAILDAHNEDLEDEDQVASIDDLSTGDVKSALQKLLDDDFDIFDWDIDSDKVTIKVTNA
jgi:hypothetical protein